MGASDSAIAETVGTLRRQLAAGFRARHTSDMGRDLARLSMKQLRQIQACGRLNGSHA